MKVICGVDQLESALKSRWKKYRSIGVLCHPASVTSSYEHIAQILDRSGRLKCLFGPQHGIYGETQYNMIEWEDLRDDKGRPIYSLYGKNRQPTKESLKGLDLMVVDLFDVGSRYYTFIYTMSYIIEACAKEHIPVLICDRPNPLGGEYIEGPMLDLAFKSFVGLHPIPVAHGLSLAEVANYFLQFHSQKADIQILKSKGWKRKYTYPQTRLAWTLPSPNMPNFITAWLYPGMCLLEGTTISEGRGTTRPFELIGAPFFNWKDIEGKYQEVCRKLRLPACTFHRQGFIPTFNKFQNELCFGALQIPPARGFRPLRHAAALLWTLRNLYGTAWTWAPPPYEYEYKKWPIDILTGGEDFRITIDSQLALKDLFDRWSLDETRFKKLRKPYLLYK